MIETSRPNSSSLPIPSTKTIGKAAIAAVALFTVIGIWPFHSVPTGSRGVVTRFGKIETIAPEGLTTLWPWEKLAIFNIRTETATVTDAQGSTSDQQPVRVSLTVRYSNQPDKVSEIYEKYSHDGDLSSYVQTATNDVFKTVTARYTAPELISQRNKVNSDIFSGLQNKLAMYGSQVNNIDITNFSFSDTYMAAINEKVTQEQLRMAAENKLKTVESEQKQKVAIAEAEATAQERQADGQAYAKLKVAQAEADSLTAQNKALSQNKDVLELRRIEVERLKADKWDGRLPQNIYAGAPIPYINIGDKPDAAKR